MARLEVRPLGAADLPACGALLAERHRRHRRAQPLLSARYEDPEVATAEVAAAYELEHASGAVAVRGGTLIGFLVGAPKSDKIWGPNTWVESAGMAATEPEAVRELYAVAAARWVDEGRIAHYVLVPTSDTDLVRAWFRLGFGQQHAHAIRDSPHETLELLGAVNVRRATRADVPRLAELDLELPRHQALSPVFSAGPVGSLEESIAEWTDDIDNPDYHTVVAELDGAVVGMAIGCALERSRLHSGLSRPDRAGFLAFAAVFPDARGRGVGRSLGEAVLAWAGEAGYDSVVTDWRVTNLLSSRAWPALGFVETFLRLHRVVGY
jgi:GNAT superfamily N-acetyltransferase